MPSRRQPVATIGQIHQPPGWFWFHCGRQGCTHHTPVAIAPFVIRWGPDASSDMIRNSLRCTKCGFKGGSMIHPSWGDMNTEWQPFPTPKKKKAAASP